MIYFVQKADVKRSVRVLTTGIADVATLNTLGQGVIEANSFECVDHIVAGETHHGVSLLALDFSLR